MIRMIINANLKLLLLLLLQFWLEIDLFFVYDVLIQLFKQKSFDNEFLLYYGNTYTKIDTKIIDIFLPNRFCYVLIIPLVCMVKS